MANVVRAWKRIVITGCTHAAHVDPVARKALLKFIDSYQPKTRVHLGDFCDTTAFMAGGKGHDKEGDDVRPDIEEGVTFLQEMLANLVFCGNHEDRLWNLCKSKNAALAFAARVAKGHIEKACQQLRAPLIPYDGAFQAYKIGNYTLMHGYMYGENAIRDHAEAHGNVIHAHTHRPGIATGRRSDNPIGICVGTLTKRRSMEYAKNRKATLSWGQAFAFGEYCDDLAKFTLCMGPTEQEKDSRWLLPG